MILFYLHQFTGYCLSFKFSELKPIIAMYESTALFLIFVFTKTKVFFCSKTVWRNVTTRLRLIWRWTDSKGKWTTHICSFIGNHLIIEPESVAFFHSFLWVGCSISGDNITSTIENRVGWGDVCSWITACLVCRWCACVRVCGKCFQVTKW